MRPVAWCAQSTTQGFLFADGRVEPFPLQDDVPIFPPGTLLLFDENPPDQGLYSFHADVFIVQATSPRLARYKSWAKQSEADYWVVPPWSRAELEAEVIYRQSQNPLLYPVDAKTYSPLETFDLIGPSTRICLGRPTAKTNPFNLSDETILHDFGLDDPLSSLFDSPRSLSRMLNGGDVDEASQGAGFHRIFYATPGPDQPSPFKRFSYTVPTPLVRRSLVALMERQIEQKQLKLAARFASSPAVFGIYFEAQAINKILSSGIVLHLEDSTSMEILKPLRGEKYDGSTEIESGVLYIPTSTCFPTLDAFLLTSAGQVVLFQATVSFNHAFKGNGVNKILTSLKRSPTPISSLDFFFAFLTPTEEAGRKLSRSFTKGRHVLLPGSTKKLPGGISSSQVALRGGYGTVDLEVVSSSFVAMFEADVAVAEKEVEDLLMQDP